MHRTLFWPQSKKKVKERQAVSLWAIKNKAYVKGPSFLSSEDGGVPHYAMGDRSEQSDVDIHLLVSLWFCLGMPRRKFLFFPVPDSAQQVMTYLVNGELESRINIKEKITM